MSLAEASSWSGEEGLREAGIWQGHGHCKTCVLSPVECEAREGGTQQVSGCAGGMAPAWKTIGGNCFVCI